MRHRFVFYYCYYYLVYVPHTQTDLYNKCFGIVCSIALLNFCQLLSTPIWPLMILLTLFIDMQAGEISARTVSCISIRNAITTYRQFGTWQSLYINFVINYSEIALYMPGIRWGPAPMKTRGTWTVSHTEKRKRWSNWDQVPLTLLGLHLIPIEKLHN